MLRKFALLSLVLLTFTGIVGAQEPTAEPVFTAEFRNFSFTYPMDIANGVDVDNVQAVTPEEAADFIDITPAHVAFNFIDWQPEILLESEMWQPVIRIYPVEGFAAFGDAASNRYQPHAEALAALLENKPTGDDLTAALPELYPEGVNVQPGVLPFLYNAMAAQVLQAQVEYLDFEGGSGIRYLTFYTQAAFSVVEEGWVFYTFQGLSADGKYYIHATFPLITNVAMLSTIPDADALMNDYPAYLSEVVAALDAQPAEAFTPSLDVLDGIVEALVIGE